MVVSRFSQVVSGLSIAPWQDLVVVALLFVLTGRVGLAVDMCETTSCLSVIAAQMSRSCANVFAGR